MKIIFLDSKASLHLIAIMILIVITIGIPGGCSKSSVAPSATPSVAPIETTSSVEKNIDEKPQPSLDEVFGRATLTGKDRVIELYPTSLEGGKYKVMSPQPMLQNVIEREGIVLYKFQKPGIEFMVYHHDLTPEEIKDNGLDSDESIFNYFRAAIKTTAESRSGGLISAKPAKLDGKYPGLAGETHCKLGSNQYNSRHRAFKIGDETVTIEVVGYDRELVFSREADRFLDSLTVEQQGGND